MGQIQICVVCGAHVGLAPDSAIDAGIHVASGYTAESLLSDFWVHFRCLGSGPGDGIAD